MLIDAESYHRDILEDYDIYISDVWRHLSVKIKKCALYM